MQLYASVTSERATKGQGGKKLMIEIMGENKEIIARLKVTKLPHYLIEVYPVTYPNLLKIEVKGHGYKLTRMEKENFPFSSHIEKPHQDDQETCNRHGSAFIERHKLDGHYICRVCVTDKVLQKMQELSQKGNKQKGNKQKDNGDCGICDAPLNLLGMCPYGC